MLNKRNIFTVLLLLLVFLTTTAEDGIRVRNCRPNGKAPKALNRSMRSAGSVNPYIGDRRQLVILVSFNDLSFSETDPLPTWDKIFNQPGYSEGSYHGSVHDYFYDQSGGQLNLTFDLYHVELNESMIKYRSTATEDDNSKYLVADLVEALQKSGVDWSQYDWDGDDEVNQVLIIFAGQGQNAGGGSNTIWPHQWWLSEHEDGEALEVTSGGRSYWVDCYCCVQEIYLDNTYSSFGTICHEYSHCFGLPDFYYGGTKYVGRWDLMDYGNNNEKGFCPPNYSAHEKMLVGWSTPIELTDAASISNMDESQAYIIHNDGWWDEYYIIENRQPSIWDQALPGSGVVVFHIDYDQKAWDTYPNTSGSVRYSIIPANNLSYYNDTNAKGWAYPYGENNQLTNESKPAASLHNTNLDGGTLMNKPLTNITITDGLASFDFMGGATGLFEKKVLGQPKILYDLGPIYIIRNAQGEIKKVMKH